MNVSTHTINMLCEILDCEVGDIMEFKRGRKHLSNYLELIDFEELCGIIWLYAVVP